MEIYYLDEWIIITLHVAGFLHPTIFQYFHHSSDKSGSGMPVLRQKPEFRPWQFIFRPYVSVFLCTNWEILDSFQTHSCFLTGNPAGFNVTDPTTGALTVHICGKTWSNVCSTRTICQLVIFDLLYLIQPVECIIQWLVNIICAILNASFQELRL